ncbi:MAG TPA: hypothetical protein PKY96_10460, partial [Flavobacteriales bacterium]|nr:hypothetical protein [Flavobacteriales bacterium]
AHCAAQTVFTPANATPAFGNYNYNWHSGQGLPASPIDTNATTGVWDFSALEFGGAFAYDVSISAATGTPFAAEHPGADVYWVYNYAWGRDHYYYRNGPDSLTLVGIM